jgi:hypothetical protein
MKEEWIVWIQKDDNGANDETLFAGCKTKAHAFYKQHGGCRAGLHIGKIILTKVNGEWV